MSVYHQQSSAASPALLDGSAVSDNTEGVSSGRVANPSGDFSCPQDVDAASWRDWFANVAPELRVEHRTPIALSALHAGLTLQEVGDLFGVSRERIRQLVERRGITVRDMRREQKYQADRRRDRLEQNIFGTSLSHPELEISELAEVWGTDPATVRQALRHRVAVHESQTPRDSHGTTDQELLDALRQWASETTNSSADDYNQWASQHRLPGKQTVKIRFGEWNRALTAAGLSHLIKYRGGLRPRLRDEELWAGMVQFYSANLPSYTAQTYDAFSAQHGLPSLATIRVRLGKWSEIHAIVRKLLRYCTQPDGSWVLGDRVAALSPKRETRPLITKAEAVASLRRVASQLSGKITAADYEAARAESDAPAAVIEARCGSWADALREAKL